MTSIDNLTDQFEPKMLNLLMEFLDANPEILFVLWNQTPTDFGPIFVHSPNDNDSHSEEFELVPAASSSDPSTIALEEFLTRPLSTLFLRRLYGEETSVCLTRDDITCGPPILEITT